MCIIYVFVVLCEFAIVLKIKDYSRKLKEKRLENKKLPNVLNDHPSSISDALKTIQSQNTEEDIRNEHEERFLTRMLVRIILKFY